MCTVTTTPNTTNYSITTIRNSSELRKDPLVYNNFTFRFVDNKKRTKCKHCDTEKASNITLFEKKHLMKCRAYLKYVEDRGKQHSQTQKGKIRDYYTPTDGSREELFALAVYTSIANFALFETPE
jgi:hypothetical protein